MKSKKGYTIKSGLAGIAIFAAFVGVLLFLNNAGVIRATEGPMFGVLMFFGWPFVLGAAIGGLMAWGGGSPTIAMILGVAGLIVNLLYAFGMGVLVGWFVRKV